MSGRIFVTRGYAVVLVALIGLTGSRWSVDSPWVSSVLIFLGLTLSAAASVGRLWCSLYIGGSKNRRLVKEGPYSVSRNPLYLFSLIGTIGIGLTTQTFLIPGLMALSFLVYYPYVIRREEETLTRLFPDELPTYSVTVPRLLPRSFSFDKPAVFEVYPRVFRSHMMSALWFVPVAAAMVVLDGLHTAGILPVLWSVY